MAICLDAQGAWQHWPGDVATPFSRMRIELDIGDGRFVPLIDGPLAGIDAALDSQPGRSTATMVVRDDSAFLNRDEEVEPPFERRSDSDIAEELFGRFEQIRETRIEGSDGDAGNHDPARHRAASSCVELALASDRHAYVLPGDEPGASIGCFLPDPEGATELPALVMIGDDRNLANASVTEDPDGAERTQAQLLRTDDQGIATFETSPEDLGLMRDLPAAPADLTPRRLLHPADNTRADPAAAATAQARRNSYVYQLTGRVVPGCYAGGADAVQQGARRRRRHAVQRRLPDHQGRPPHHALALYAGARGQDRLGHRGVAAPVAEAPGAAQSSAATVGVF